jgi:glycosyltransferase involved in cell wall biosynthesis
VERTISIVTPAYRPVAEFIAAAWSSVLSQRMPAGWQWQWVIQEDGEAGEAGELARMLPADPRISLGRSRRRGGEPTTRNLCLSRASGELIKVLDADDQLAPGTLARDIEALSSRPDIGWATSRAVDLLPDGTTAGFDTDPAEGRIECGAVLEHWRTHDFLPQVHPATLCIRRELVFALGGWTALPASGDTGLLLAANAISAGYFTAQTGLLYRKWPGQMTSQAAHSDDAERSARMAVIEARAMAMAALWSGVPTA